MIITRTPMRVSFLGGGSDYPEHYLEHGGQVVGAAIDHYSYLSVNELPALFDHRIRLSYSRTEMVRHALELEHPAVREVLTYLPVEGGVEIHYAGDLPARTGLGTSSSFTVGLLHAIHALRGEMVSSRKLAEEAVHVEREMIREQVGVQDQHLCAMGGLLNIRFHRDGSIDVRPLPIERGRAAELESCLMLAYTGVRRHAHEIVTEQLNRTRAGALRSELSRMSELTESGVEVLCGSRPLREFGELLDEAWTVKKSLSGAISSCDIDGMYRKARDAGAVGGKLLGAGGGGFLLLFVEPDRQADVSAALREFSMVDFAFDYSGSTLLFYSPGRRPASAQPRVAQHAEG